MSIYKYNAKTKTTSGAYATYDLSGWIHEIDNEQDMLRCPDCRARVQMEFYLLAVGTSGTRFCPYCGKSKHQGGGKR